MNTRLWALTNDNTRMDDDEIQRQFDRISADTELASEWIMNQPNPYGLTHYFLHLENNTRKHHDDPVPKSGLRSERVVAWNNMFEAIELWSTLYDSPIKCFFSTTGPLPVNVIAYRCPDFENYDYVKGKAPDADGICEDCITLVESVLGQKFWRFE